MVLKLPMRRAKRRGKILKGKSKGAEKDDYLGTTWAPTLEFPDYLGTRPKEKHRTNSNGGFGPWRYAVLADHHFLIEGVVIKD